MNNRRVCYWSEQVKAHGCPTWWFGVPCTGCPVVVAVMPAVGTMTAGIFCRATPTAGPPVLVPGARRPSQLCVQL